MNAEEFIKLAGRIISFGPAGVRSAVSRAYYGAFNEAMDVLEGIGCGCPRNGKAHNLVVVFLIPRAMPTQSKHQDPATLQAFQSHIASIKRIHHIR